MTRHLTALSPVSRRRGSNVRRTLQKAGGGDKYCKTHLSGGDFMKGKTMKISVSISNIKLKTSNTYT
jgi:hypothetical protein